MQSSYEGEEEEGYVSGEYDDGFYELMKIRIKVRIFYVHRNAEKMKPIPPRRSITEMTFEEWP
jgi:hypothetical protein